MHKYNAKISYSDERTEVRDVGFAKEQKQRSAPLRLTISPHHFNNFSCPYIVSFDVRKFFHHTSKICPIQPSPESTAEMM